MIKIKSYTKLFYTLVLTAVIIQNGYSQNNKAANMPDNNNVTNYYRLFTVGANSPLYRDFATSPLFYRGAGIQLQTAWLKVSNIHEHKLEIGFGYSSLLANIQNSDNLQPTTGSSLMQLNIRYLQLWKINSISTENFNIKLGGVVHITQNFRNNAALLNNSVGIENLTNVMLSGQFTTDISRNEPCELNFWLFKHTLKPVKRDLKIFANVGLLNFNYRPGYAYSYISQIVGTETNSLSWLISNYKWSLNGWRINAGAEYIKYLKNGNAKSLSYVWDAANAPGKHEKFQLASHQIIFTYYFNANKF